MTTEAKNQPDARGLAHQRQAEAVEICRDVYGGTLRMRSKRQRYLPQFPGEENDAYDARLKSSVLYNAFARTVSGLVGMVFRKDPTFGDDVPKEIEAHLENVDLCGRHGAVFARDVFEDAVTDGHAHIFVDMQQVEPGQAPTLADERQLGLRPYWVALKKQDILRFRTVNVNGRPVITELAYRERTAEPDGTYGEREVERVRIYRRGVGEDGKPAVTFEIWANRRADGAASDSWVRDSEGTMRGISRIPLATDYTRRVGFLESAPPLLDLAIENVLHYQTRSDRCNNLHIAATPIPVIIGAESDEGKVQIVASNRAIELPLHGDAKYLEPTGAALAHSRDELKDIEARMAALGLAMLERDTRAAETAEAKRIDKSASDSQLSAAARGLQDALEEALGLHAEWLGLGQDAGGSVSVNRDFEKQQLSPQMLTALSSAVGAGQLRLETMWDVLVRGDVLPESFDPETERDGLDNADIDRLPVPA